MRPALIVMGLLLVVGAFASAASGDEVRRMIPEHRPYIVEIGDPQLIGQDRLREEMKRNNDLRDYVGYYGFPEAAEIQEIRPDAPWDTYEVRLYYLRRDQEVTFGQAFVNPTETYGIVTYEGLIRPEDRERLASRVGAEGDDVFARVARAADRAAAAAERAEAESMDAAHAADRAARTVERMEAGFHAQLRK